MDAIRNSGIHLGVDPLGGAGVHYWGPIAERYGLNLKIVNDAVDPTFRFMTLDWDGRIRMDPSSPYAMRPLTAMKDQFDICMACDTDHDRHGIVTKSSGLPTARDAVLSALIALSAGAAAALALVTEPHIVETTWGQVVDAVIGVENFRLQSLRRSVRQTFERRRTPIPGATPVAFSKSFLLNENKQTQWKALGTTPGWNCRRYSPSEWQSRNSSCHCWEQNMGRIWFGPRRDRGDEATF